MFLFFSPSALWEAANSLIFILSVLSFNKNFFCASYEPQHDVTGTIHMPGPEDPSDRNCACKGTNDLATTFQYNISTEMGKQVYLASSFRKIGCLPRKWHHIQWQGNNCFKVKQLRILMEKILMASLCAIHTNRWCMKTKAKERSTNIIIIISFWSQYKKQVQRYLTIRNYLMVQTTTTKKIEVLETRKTDQVTRWDTSYIAK